MRLTQKKIQELKAIYSQNPFFSTIMHLPEKETHRVRHFCVSEPGRRVLVCVDKIKLKNGIFDHWSFERHFEIIEREKKIEIIEREKKNKKA